MNEVERITNQRDYNRRLADHLKTVIDKNNNEIANQRDRIEALEARIAKADALAICLQDTVGYFAEFDGLRKRAEEHLAAYREGSDT